MTEFSSNTFEHDYIIRELENMIVDLRTDKSRTQIIDKYACNLTSFMNGQIIATVKQLKGE